MKKVVLGLALVLAGTAAGAGGGWALLTFMPDLVPPATESAEGEGHAAAGDGEEATSIIPAGRVLAPLVYKDGTLAGYGGFQVQIEVTEADAADITARLPILLHAINMRTFKAPLAAGPDGMIPDLDVFRVTVQQAADESFGKGKVKRVLVTEAAPG
jgi:hypothetical protein